MKHHRATEAIEAIIGPHLPRDCARELAESIVENLLAAGLLLRSRAPGEPPIDQAYAAPIPVGPSGAEYRGVGA